MFQSISECRSCKSPRLTEVLALGELPLADAFLTESELARPEPRYPLNVTICENCSLVQLRETVDPGVLFGSDYPYYSSFSPAWLNHCRANAEELIEARQLNQSSLVVEIASNDGYMLKNFHQRGIPTLGIDPVPGPAAAAEKLGIRTVKEFFGLELARSLNRSGQLADVVIANNVLAHVADLSGIVSGIRTILKPDGVAVVEVPYVRDLVDHCEFDTIYHEHLCYFSLTALNTLLADRDLQLSDVRRLPTHGGSLRLYIQHGGAASPKLNVSTILQEEREAGIDSVAYYSDFASRVLTLQKRLRSLLNELHSSGNRIAGYGAAAKGTTLLNSSRIHQSHLEFIVDRNVHKHGRHMPGLRTPITPTELLLAEMPDYVLLLAWNFKDEIIRQQAEYLRRGGKFIVPVPDVTIEGAASPLSAAS